MKYLHFLFLLFADLSFKPMLRTEHNGEGFRYVISYKRDDVSGAQEIIHEEHDWRQSELRIPHQETYKPYVIYVQAVNNVGSAPGEPDKKLGFSGEDGIIDALLPFIYNCYCFYF